MAETNKAEVVVVGSGASGAPIAFALARAGVDVVMLEKGDWVPRDEKCEDELAQLHLEIYRPSGEDDPTVIRSGGEVVAETSRLGQSFYIVGGGTVRYSGTSWRFREEDFKKLSTYGAVPGATLCDWPFAYSELEPYYTQAEEEIGISGVAGADPTEPKRSRDVLLPPLKEDHFQKRLAAAAKTLGWRPFPIPIAIHSQRHEKTGGYECMQCGWCSGFPCLYQAKSAVDVTIYPRASKTGHFTLRTKAYATRVDAGKDGKVTGVEYLDLESGTTKRIACRALVLAASAIQTTRLLMLSGLANRSGLLGRNLMFHIECKASALFDDVFPQGLYKKLGIHDFYHPVKGEGFINHRSLQSGSKAPPIAFALSRSGFGEGLARDVRDAFLRTQEVQCMVEDLPQSDNRVVLSATKKDPWGIPAPEVNHRYHDMDRTAARAANEKIRALMQAAGGSDIRIPDVHANVAGRYSWHLMGTARMGRDPAASVVNPDCAVHEHPNLWIVDGSVFPTSAGLNPSLTMQALSFRAADRLLAAMKEGKI